ncbi:unnamed protein product [Mycena citricolor]|uniref:Uncharacterized protein n=1 Tax=Mycena citricolor TaxID=2018698 RepID=A0AAD2HMN4_9AGAR|nr:unnamed protein product [Mycena citricolor]
MQSSAEHTRTAPSLRRCSQKGNPVRKRKVDGLLLAPAMPRAGRTREHPNAAVSLFADTYQVEWREWSFAQVGRSIPFHCNMHCKLLISLFISIVALRASSAPISVDGLTNPENPAAPTVDLRETELTRSEPGNEERGCRMWRCI